VSSRYANVALDLSVARDRVGIPVTLAARIATVNAQVVPGAASIHFGQGGEPIRLIQGKDYRPCPPESDGIFVSNVASSGLLILTVTFEGGAIEINGDDETVAGAAQIAYGRANQAGSVNSGPIIQLYNPANSDKQIKVTRVTVSSASNGNIYLAFERNQLGTGGGGVLTNGSKRFMDRNLAPANPMTVSDDAGISGLIRGSTFDNGFWTEYGLAPGAAFQFPTTSATNAISLTATLNVGEFLLTGQFFVLPPGWGAAVQHGVNGAGILLTASFYGTEGGV